jgi:hypothetical protein
MVYLLSSGCDKARVLTGQNLYDHAEESTQNSGFGFKKITPFFLDIGTVNISSMAKVE